MALWKAEKHGSLPKLKSAVLIVGLPGIGNVGKISTDFIIEELKAKKLYSFYSHRLPHSVYINEDNLIELPKINLYYSKKNIDVLLLTGDVQPIDEESCYEFCELVLDKFQELRGKEIITLGGIGLRMIPKDPKIYCTGNSQKIILRYKKDTELKPNLYGVVGPIIGVSGLLLGLAQRRDIEAICLLAETFGHPVYIGLKGSKKVVKILDKKLSLGINMKNLEKEINMIESQFKKAEALTQMTDDSKFLKKGRDETNYIG